MRVKGNVLKARREFVVDTFGQEDWERVLESLSEFDRALLKGLITNTGWYPFETAERLDAAIVDVLGEGKWALYEHLGRMSARSNLTGVHRTMLVEGDPLTFLKKAAMIYTFYYDTGHRTFRSTGQGAGVITTYDAETYSATDCATVVGWYKEALEMCGATGVTIAEEECRAHGGLVCRYRVHWNEPSASRGYSAIEERAALNSAIVP